MSSVVLALLLSATATAQPLSRVVDYEPAWSPDGQHLAFISNRGGPLKLYRMRADGTDIRVLTDGEAEDDAPAWSPDGSRIAFVSLRDGNPEIYVMPAVGGVATRLTHDPGLDLHPQWSPDGRRLLWNTSRRSANADAPETIELWTMAADGSAPTPLLAGGIATYASWSPDGKRLLYRRQGADGNSEIMVAGADGSAPVNISQHPAFDGWPAWSRNGQRVVFAREDGDAAGLWLLPANGGEARRLETPAGRCTNPRWSPTADQVVFSCRAERQVRLYLLDIPASP